MTPKTKDLTGTCDECKIQGVPVYYKRGMYKFYCTKCYPHTPTLEETLH